MGIVGCGLMASGIAVVFSRPEQMVGMHFFNPVPVLALVELVPSLRTSAETLRRVQDLAEEDLRKTVIRSQERADFIVNALLIPYLLASIRMLESGFASAADIDRGMARGCAYPLGPLQLADLIGLDTTTAIAASMYSESKEPLYAPSPLLRTVDAGLLGRKSVGGLMTTRAEPTGPLTAGGREPGAVETFYSLR